MIMLKKITGYTFTAIILFTLYSGLTIAHGKVNLDADICVRNISGSMVHLSTYQPQYDPAAEYSTKHYATCLLQLKS